MSKSNVSGVIAVAKYAALAALGFAAVRIAVKASESIKAGTATVKAVAGAVADVVSTDLNPASDKNLAYRGVNNIGAQITDDPSFNLGAKLWEWSHASKVAAEKALTAGKGLPSDAADVTRQVIAQENFRRSEIVAENEEAKRQEYAEQATMKSKSDFRVMEIIAQENGGQSATSFDKFLNTIAGTFR